MKSIVTKNLESSEESYRSITQLFYIIYISELNDSS